MTMGSSFFPCRSDEDIRRAHRADGVGSFPATGRTRRAPMGEARLPDPAFPDPTGVPEDRDLFAGRTEEMRRIEDWYRNRPECPCMAISGFYGTGKTRLCERFSRKHRDRILSVFVHASRFRGSMEVSDPMRDILRRIRKEIVGLGIPGLPGNAASERESPREALRGLMRHAAGRGKGVLLIFDDADILEEDPSAPLLGRFLERIGALAESLRFPGESIPPPKFLVSGQYRLYRHLARKRRDGSWLHLPLSRRIEREACVDWANRRLESHRKRFPGVSPSPDFGERAVRLAGRAPRDLRAFLDMFFRESRFPEPGGLSERTDFGPGAMADAYYRILADPALSVEIFDPLETHYLRGEENGPIARIVEALARSPDKGLPESALSADSADRTDVRRRIFELTDFGFADRRRDRGRWGLRLPRSLTTDFFRVHFHQPFLER
jgi:hypothetical protein